MDECSEFFKAFDFDDIESLLWVLEFSDLFPSLPVNVSMISSNFKTIESDLLINLSPSAMSKILKCDDLTIESEDSLFEFLLEYSKKWNDKSLPLFENVYFEYLSESNLAKFIELHSQFERYFQFQFHSSLFESFLFLLQSKPRSAPKHRHSSQSVSNSIPSLFKCRQQIESLKCKNIEFQNTISALSSDKSNLLNQIQLLTQSNSSLKNDLNQSLSKKTELQQTNSVLNSDKSKLTSDIKELQTKNLNL
jgi:hypothetical protein